MGDHAPQDTRTPAAIPDKLYFRIGEVASLCGVEAYVLRFWQTEFPQLSPKKSGTGQRLYRKRDVEHALRIKRLLHEEGYTIAGARQVFAAEAQQQRLHPGPRSQPELPLAVAAESAESHQAREQLERTANRAQTQLARLRLELRELLSLLSQAPAPSSAPTGRPRHGKATPLAEGSLFDQEPES